MFPDQLTCVVPTHNRPCFLRRLLRFYRQFPPSFSIQVIDSSVPSAALENLAVIDGVRGCLKIGYRHFDLNIVKKCAEGLELVRSPFVVLCADDDFLFPEATLRCAEFLESEPSFSSAMGRSATLNVGFPSRRCKIRRGYSIHDNRPLDRCHKMAAHWFTNFYAVYRTEILVNNFRLVAANSDPTQSVHISEMLLSQLSVLRGGIKVLPLMYSLSEVHDSNFGSERVLLEQSQAELLFQRFKDCLLDQFVNAGIERKDGERLIDDSYSFYSKPGLAHRCRSLPGRLRDFAVEIVDRAADCLWTDMTRRRRYVRTSDIKGSESIWHFATQLMREFPQGIPSDQVTLRDCA